MRVTVGWKLRLGFLSLLALIITMGAVSNGTMMEMGDRAEEVKTMSMPSVAVLGQIQADVINIERLYLRLLIESVSTEKIRLESRINAMSGNLQRELTLYDTLVSSEEERGLYKSLLTYQQSMQMMLPKIVKAGMDSDIVTANKYVAESRESFNNLIDTLESLIQLNKRNTDEALDATLQLNESGKRIVDILSISAVLFGVIVSWFIPRMISRPVVLMTKAAKRIAAGDLSADEIRVSNRDEIGDLTHSLNVMANSLRGLIREIGVSAESVASSSQELTAISEQIGGATEQIAQTMEKVAAGSEKQTLSISESANSINELSAGVRHIAVNAESATFAANEASEIATKGNQTIQTTVKQMNAINRTVGGLAQAVQGLGERSQEIGNIVAVITGIASQTNLLALNAAIEAARVGEHGSGFAVVANEVRKLAEQSRLSAEQIALLITSIQDETNQAIELMEVGTQDVAEGMIAVNVAGESFERIQRSVIDVAGKIQEVSAASEQMSASTEQVVHSINLISDIAATNSSGTQHVSTAVEEQLASMQEITASSAALSRMSEELQGLVGKFSV